MSYPEELDGLRYEKDVAGKTGYVIFDRPPMNVLSYPARAQIAKLIAAMDEDDEIRVIVIRGANALYSSGGDIAGFLKVPRDGMHDLAWNVAAPERAKKPVIAAIEKYAMGVAFELALACDFRLVTESSQLALPEINLGITPGSGGTVRIAHLAGLTRAKEMIMRGRRISAREAFEWGLITEVVPDGKLDEAIARWANDLASRPVVPLTAQPPPSDSVSPFGFPLPPALYFTTVVWVHPESVTTSVPDSSDESANVAGRGFASTSLSV